jgi:hypothetical protein
MVANVWGGEIFMMLLIEAWGLCVTNADRILLVQTVENFVYTGVFGTEESHSQWKVPINKENEIEQISFTAWRERKIFARLNTLVPQLRLDGTRLIDWQCKLSKYLEVIKSMRTSVMMRLNFFKI